MSCKREVSSGHSFFPTPFPVICGKGSAEAEQSRAAVEGVGDPSSCSARTDRAKRVALHYEQGRRAGG